MGSTFTNRSISDELLCVKCGCCVVLAWKLKQVLGPEGRWTAALLWILCEINKKTKTGWLLTSWADQRIGHQGSFKWNIWNSWRNGHANCWSTISAGCGNKLSVFHNASIAASLWHWSLGHTTKLTELEGLVEGMEFPAEEEVPSCEGCVEGKLAKKPFKPIGKIHSERRMQFIYSDVCKCTEFFW